MSNYDQQTSTSQKEQLKLEDDHFNENHEESLPDFASVLPDQDLMTAVASNKKQHFRQVDQGEEEIKSPPPLASESAESLASSAEDLKSPSVLTRPRRPDDSPLEELHMRSRDPCFAPQTSIAGYAGKQKTLGLAPPMLVPPRKDETESERRFPRSDVEQDPESGCPAPPEFPRRGIFECPGAYRIRGYTQDNEDTIMSTRTFEPPSQGGAHPGGMTPNNDRTANDTLVSAELVPPERLLPMVTPTHVITERQSRCKNRHLVLAACGIVLAGVIGLVVGLLMTRATNPPTPVLLSTGDWQQLGQVLVGEMSGDTFGRTISLSADGNLLAVGAHFNDENGVDAGKVQVFQWDSASSTWTQSGQDLTGEEPGDRFGDSVSLSDNGNVLAVGASRNDANGEWAGQVKVFQLDGGTSTWTQQGADLIGAAEKDRFGWAVSLSADGRVVAIGSNFAKFEGNSTGKVQIYEFHTGSWRRQGQDLVGEAPGDRFGYSVSLSADGSIVAIGARMNDPDGKNDAGRVQVYQWKNSESKWIRVGDLHGEATNDEFGYSVSLSANGHVVAVGAKNSNDGFGGFEEGKALVFKWDGGSWEKLGQDLVGEASSDHFGVYVSLSWDGYVVAVGADQYENVGGNATGYVNVYSYQLSENEWQQVGSVLTGSENHDQFGTCVSLSKDGTIIGVGATQWAHPNPDPPGYVQVFHLQEI